MTGNPLEYSEIIATLQKEIDLKERYERNLKRKDPLSFINIARLCYGDKTVEQYQAKHN